ncbi:MAG: DUF565 domain-containing protein [Okeania sp. SIO2G4]|uniref:DUF565 domain-containing protein n=1 Tax=unclassified Okeania TaxID=2634635 RepID=UPI0013BB1785|nr:MULTISPECIES: DUF565 domain-containing protein [unclassified Okeania]NEP39143.1 DUF565 domain-containing protein [Okeania sp. SIO2H7]NEP74078.1 DUF565 domain-containing protein [Okeania sp. SIO2G5]NEP94923.1 DUF565 domain-containing protein [Okeania sp. SIO2F5]NEQ92639.1 DUF565 domain-containing protein [Okeania sp. SIO2G4]
MQSTRINRLFNVISERFRQWFSNPWRRISLLVISLLFGNFAGTAVSTIAGQEGYLDVIYALICLLITELLNWFTYGIKGKIARSLGIDILNGFKIGFTYGLFLEAFKLGS